MGTDRITQLRIQGLRSIERAVIDLSGLTVLIGDNGTGKSTILEALEILRFAGQDLKLTRDIITKRHGGLRSLLRHGASEVSLGVSVGGNGSTLHYDFTLSGTSDRVVISRESLTVAEDESAPRNALTREDGSVTVDIAVLDPSGSDRNDALGVLFADNFSLLLPRCAARGSAPAARVADALSAIELHVPLRTRPVWQQPDIRVGPRFPSVVEGTLRLDRFGDNLAAAFLEARSRGDEAWQRIVGRVALGLGEDVREVRLSASGRGNVELSVLFGTFPDTPVPVEDLSEGQVAFLAFVIIAELGDHRSLLAFDEPELHLHPALLTRVLFMLEEVAQRHPVLLSTHSDRLLDALSAPADQVVLCELDENRATRLVRPNAERLASWMQDYRGLGSIRAEGYEPHVFDETPVEPEDAP